MSINRNLRRFSRFCLRFRSQRRAQGLLRLATSGLGIGPVAGATPGAEPDLSGFYGGIARRDHGTDAGALSLGPVPSAAWSRYTAPAGDDATRSLFWGGYRWRNDLAVEAASASRDQYALKPDRSLPVGRGVGLQLASDAGPSARRQPRRGTSTSSPAGRSTAASRCTAGWAMRSPKTTVLYGPLAAADGRRTRDGMNYGVGMRYDMNSALGLRLEYGRFGRFAGEFAGSLPETDQVTLGVQLRLLTGGPPRRAALEWRCPACGRATRRRSTVPGQARHHARRPPDDHRYARLPRAPARCLRHAGEERRPAAGRHDRRRAPFVAGGAGRRLRSSELAAGPRRAHRRQSRPRRARDARAAGDEVALFPPSPAADEARR